MKKDIRRVMLLFALVNALFATQILTSAYTNDFEKVQKNTKLKSFSDSNKRKKTNSRQPQELPSSAILFEENRGQFARNIKFASRAADYNFYLTQTGAVFSIPNLKQPEKSPFILNMRMTGANMQPEIQGIEEVITKTAILSAVTKPNG